LSALDIWNRAVGGLSPRFCYWRGHHARIANLAFLRPNYENFAIFRSGLTANILFGLLLVFLKIWPNFDLICM